MSDKSKIITFNFIVFIVLGSTVAQVATQITMPILPVMASAFHVSPGLVQLSITSYLLGMAISGIFLGYLSDFLGRRRIMLFALLVSAVGTLCCMAASNVYFVIFGRFIQGIGLSGVWIISRAITRDKSIGAQLARLFSVLAILDVLIICVSPLIGGLFQKYFGWRSVFGVFFIYTALVALMTCIFDGVNSSAPDERQKLSGLFHSLAQLMKNKLFQPFNISAGCIYASHMVYASVGSFLFEKKLGLSPTQFGSVAMFISIAYIFGAFLNSKLVMHLSMQKILFMALGLMWFSILFLMLYVSRTGLSLHGLLIFVILDAIAGSIILLNGITMALSSVEKKIGTCSAFMSTSQFIIGGVFSAVMSCFTIDSVMPLVAVSAVLAFIISIMSMVATYPKRD